MMNAIENDITLPGATYGIFKIPLISMAKPSFPYGKHMFMFHVIFQHIEINLLKLTY